MGATEEKKNCTDKKRTLRSRKIRGWERMSLTAADIAQRYNNTPAR